MAKKFGKVLLLTAAAASAAAFAYYFLQKKEAAQNDEDDYDDFSDDLESDSDNLRSYVPLNHEAAGGHDTDASTEQPESESASCDSSPEQASDETSSPAQDTPGDVSQDTAEKEDGFTPLAEQTAGTAENSVEKFFDEDDSSDTASPADHN